MKTLEANIDGSISHFMHGDLWKNLRLKFSPNTLVIPIMLYSDDFNPDNALSGNVVNKQCTFQYTFPVLPQHLLTSTEYVFEALLFPSRIKALEGGLENSLIGMIDVFARIEKEGIVLTINNESVQVFFVMCLKIGDNLDMNEMLGFQKSFNANSFCRFCRTKSAFTKFDSIIREDSLRNELNFLEDLEKDNPKATGICFNSVFNNLQYFHVTRNFYCDMMHDLWEGICKYVLSNILKYYIYDKKKFTLKTFNNLKNQFDYGEIEVNNTCGEISDIQIKNSSINITASQMKCLWNFLPLMIGSLISEDDSDYEYWELVLKLQEIIDMLLLSKFTTSSLEHLTILISRFMQQYIKLFGALKPKFHFLLHYPKCISQIGPLRNVMCFVFEQKNREVKAYSNVMNQRINLSFSLAFKSSMRFTNLIKKHIVNGFPPVSIHKDPKPLAWADITQKKYFEHTSQFFETLTGKENIFQIKSVIYKKKTFRQSYYVIITDNNNVQLYKIIDIIQVNNLEHIIVEEIKVQEYSSHYGSFKVGSSKNLFKVILLEDIKHLPFNLHTTVEGLTYFRIKNI